MRKWKNWLIRSFLPNWAKETLMDQVAALQEENRSLRMQLKEKEAYIAGLESGVRAQRRIIINNHGEAGK